MSKPRSTRRSPGPKTRAQVALKVIPTFRSEDEEREFWATADPTEYFDWSSARRVTFPNLRPSTQTISLRSPQDLLDDLKVPANPRDIP